MNKVCPRRGNSSDKILRNLTFKDQVFLFLLREEELKTTNVEGKNHDVIERERESLTYK